MKQSCLWTSSRSDQNDLHSQFEWYHESVWDRSTIDKRERYECLQFERISCRPWRVYICEAGVETRSRVRGSRMEGPRCVAWLWFGLRWIETKQKRRTKCILHPPSIYATSAHSCCISIWERSTHSWKIHPRTGWYHADTTTTLSSLPKIVKNGKLRWECLARRTSRILRPNRGD